MSTKSRYLVRQLVLPTLAALTAFMGALWLSQSLRFVDLIVNNGLPLGSYLYLTGLLTPSLLWIILPFAVLVGVLFTYNRLISDSEITAFKAAGFGNFSLARPALAVATLAVIANYVVALWAMPTAYRQFRDLQFAIRGDFSFLRLEAGVFTSPIPGVTIYVRATRGEGDLRGIIVHDARDQGRPQTFLAERGRLLEGDAAPRLILENGAQQQREDGVVNALYFDRYTLDLALTDGGSGDGRWRKPRERYLNELLIPTGHPDDLTKRNDLLAAAHERLSWPLSSLAFAMIGLTALLPRQHGRRGASGPITAAVLAALFVQVAALIAKNAAEQAPVLAALQYLAVILPIVLCAIVLARGRIVRRSS